jgi:hypothetical protein
MLGAGNTRWEDEKCIQSFGQKTRREETTWKTTRRWEHNIGTDLRDIG